MTATELYEQDAHFRGFLQAWDEDRRCPYPLADWLTDHYPDMIGPAKCARWCATQPDRPVWMPLDCEKKTPCGPYPAYGMWWFFVPEEAQRDACSVPKKMIVRDVMKDDQDTSVEAILALMDAWNPEAEL